MEYQQNLLHNTLNQPSKFKTKDRVEINDESRGTQNKNNQVRFKTSMLRSSLCNCTNACILVNPIRAGRFFFGGGLGDFAPPFGVFFYMYHLLTNK